MKTFKLLAVIFILAFSISCEKDDETFDSKSDIVGTWINPQFLDNTFQVIKYDRSSSLIDNDYGFTFNTDLTFVERKNAGWCGTPPISYADFNGDWEELDSTITISVAYWGGMVEYEWRIQSFNNDVLIIEVVEENYSEHTDF